MNKKIVLIGNNLRMHLIFRLDLMKHLQNQGYQVIVICPRLPQRQEQEKYIKILNEEKIEYWPLYIDAKGVNPVVDLVLLIRLCLTLKKIKPDFVLNYTIKPVIYGSMAATLLSIKTVAVITGAGYVFINRNLKSVVARWLYKLSLRRVSRVLFLNQDDLQLFLSLGIVSDTKVNLLPGEGVDIREFKRSGSRAPGNSRLNFNFLFIGRILYDKGVKELAEAARLLRENKVLSEINIVGEMGSDNPSSIDEDIFNSWIKEGVFHYQGYSFNIKSEIEKADCIVLPSYREGIPKVLLEAAAMEKPVITTDVPGCRDVVIDEKTGLLVQSKDAKSLYKAMLKIASFDKEQLMEMGKNGRLLVEQKYANEIVFEIYRNLLSQI